MAERASIPVSDASDPPQPTPTPTHQAADPGAAQQSAIPHGVADIVCEATNPYEIMLLMRCGSCKMARKTKELLCVALIE